MSQRLFSDYSGFSKEDDDTLIRFIAENNPGWKGRKGVKLYKRLVNETNNGTRHTWKSWQHRYSDHFRCFDEQIEEYQREHGISLPEARSKPSDCTTKRKYAFSEEEDALLIAYIARNDSDGKRKGLQLYNGLAKHDGKIYGRSSKAWCHRYTKNMAYIDFKVQEYQRKRRLTVVKPVDSAYTHDSISDRLSVESSSRFGRKDDQNLAEYLASNNTGPEDRKSLRTYKMLTDSANRDKFPWAAERKASSWMARYQANAAYFEALILEHTEKSAERIPRSVSERKRKRVRLSCPGIDARGSSSTPSESGSASTISVRKGKRARFPSQSLGEDSASSRLRRQDANQDDHQKGRRLRDSVNLVYRTRSHTRAAQTTAYENDNPVGRGTHYDGGSDSEEVAVVDSYLREVNSESESDLGEISFQPTSSSARPAPAFSRSWKFDCVSITRSSKSTSRVLD